MAVSYFQICNVPMTNRDTAMVCATTSPSFCNTQATCAAADASPLTQGCRSDDATVRFWRDADIDAVEVRYSHFDGYRFPAHVHDTWSVGLVDAGHSVFRLSGRTQSVQTGQIAVIPPGAVHDCNPDVGAWTYRMFYVQDSLMRSLACGLAGGAGQMHAGSGIGISAGMAGDVVAFDSLVIDDAEVFTALSDFQRLIEFDDLYGVEPLAKRSAMTEAFSLLLSRYGSVRDATARLQEEREAVRRVREYLADNMSEKVTLDVLSAQSGLSGYHLLRVFRDEVGLTPHQWQAQLRINRAKVLLAEGAAIADVACSVGFTDQSHFTRTFRAVTGATPRLYRLAQRVG